MGKGRLKRVISDVAKLGAKFVAAPVNSLTGHEYDPVMKTRIGNLVEKGIDFAEDVVSQGVTTATGGVLKKVGLYDGEIETKAGKIVGTAVGIGAMVFGGSAIASEVSSLASSGSSLAKLAKVGLKLKNGGAELFTGDTRLLDQVLSVVPGPELHQDFEKQDNEERGLLWHLLNIFGLV
jgi:hypothetical protein